MESPMSEKHPQSEQNTAPAQGQMYIPPQYYQPQEDEIDLRELFGVLWKGKWWIIGITALFAIASVFYALSLPNEYKATAIVAPASESGGGGLSKMAGQLGGLASLAGVNLGSSETTDDVIAMEIMKTWGFIDEFIKKHELQVAIFAAKGWDQSKNELIIDDELYDLAQKNWIRKAPKGKTVEPTSWELYKEFSENVAVSKNKNTGLISISYMHYSPEYAQKITQWLTDDINALLKDRALEDATKNINYLEAQINKTSLSGMQKVFYSLIEEQTKEKMLADVSEEYVFKTIDKAFLPEEKFTPKRALIVLIWIFLAGIFATMFVLIKHFIRKK